MSSSVVLLHAFVLLQFKARLGSLWLKHHLGSEVREKEEPEKAVFSTHCGSGQPPQAWGSMLGALGRWQGERDLL